MKNINTKREKVAQTAMKHFSEILPELEIKVKKIRNKNERG